MSCRGPRPASCNASGCARPNRWPSPVRWSSLSRPHPMADHSPRHLILSLFGLYGRGETNGLSVRSLIALMEDLEVDAAATRSSVSRLKKRGVLVSARSDGQAGYALSPT